MSEPISGAELLARIQPVLPVESVEICLRPDLIDQWDEAQEQLQELAAAGMKGQRVASKPAGQRELAKKVLDLEAEIEKASAVFRLRAMPKDEWRALCDDHPPRKGNDLDAFSGFDRDAVLDAAVRKCLFDPVFDDASWPELVAILSGGEWDELRKTANAVNRGVVEPPKSELASRLLSPPAND